MGVGGEVRRGDKGKLNDKEMQWKWWEEEQEKIELKAVRDLMKRRGSGD